MLRGQQAQAWPSVTQRLCSLHAMLHKLSVLYMLPRLHHYHGVRRSLLHSKAEAMQAGQGPVILLTTHCVKCKTLDLAGNLRTCTVSSITLGKHVCKI